MLDRTMVVYGAGNSRTHVNENHALLLAGFRGLGLKHGRFLELPDSTPLSNLFVTILNRLDVPSGSFADSTGELPEIVA